VNSFRPPTASLDADKKRVDRLPLNVAMSVRERQREGDARIARAEPAIRSLLPIVLALARMAAMEGPLKRTCVEMNRSSI
jgi:hypothetical protein